MATQTLDLLGLKCPQPVLKIATMAKELPAGETVEILADCESFPKDIAAWCTKTGKTLMFCVDEGGREVQGTDTVLIRMILWRKNSNRE